ncbi:MAG TPA: gamma-glutamyltransferase [Rhizomicrobium sp.]
MKRLVPCAAAFLLSVTALCAQTPARHHMIAAANPYAAQGGLEMLRRHGSAVDAAIAAQMVLTLVEPESSGLGGGAFLVLWDPAKKRVTSFDGRESAPASATPGMFLDADGTPRAHFDAIPGGLSVGVPGVVAMLWSAHKKYGRLPWASLFAPAIRLAQNGFPVGHKLAATIRQYAAMQNMPDIKRYFFHADGTPLAEGEILRNRELAASLRAIARGGPGAFYSGPIARSIVSAVQHAPVNPGGMTLSDLARYKAQQRNAVCGSYRVYRICSMGPPSSGGIAILQILKMLQRFPSAQLVPESVSEVHLFTQASRLAFADRAKYLADPGFVHVPVSGLLDPAYLARRSALIDPARDMGQAEAGDPPTRPAYAPQTSPVLHGTSHMTIVDDSGQAISMTTSVEFVFGAEIMAGGFFLNNTLTDFSFQPVRDGLPVANAPAPYKRPLSAMSPTLVFDAHGHFLMGLGSPGGPAIIDYVAQTLLAMLDGGLGPQPATALPHQLNMNGPTLLEQSPGASALAARLTAMGHNVQTVKGESSGLQVIEQVPGGYIGGADPRRDGVALGD